MTISQTKTNPWQKRSRKDVKKLSDNEINEKYEQGERRILLEMREEQKSKYKYYTGVGSRETPQVIIETIKKISYRMGQKGYILRSGGADGADLAFELGYTLETVAIMNIAKLSSRAKRGLIGGDGDNR
jgi:hypothetical protein